MQSRGTQCIVVGDSPRGVSARGLTLARLEDV
jgi:hypothetical protein